MVTATVIMSDFEAHWWKNKGRSYEKYTITLMTTFHPNPVRCTVFSQKVVLWCGLESDYLFSALVSVMYVVQSNPLSFEHLFCTEYLSFGPLNLPTQLDGCKVAIFSRPFYLTITSEYNQIHLY